MLAVGPFGLGFPEMLLILAVVFIIFGVGRLPEVGGAVGRSIREFRKASKEPDELEAPAEDAAPSECSKCSAEIAPNVKFCAECGAPVQAPVN
jgi:sec-independent protein translocase protein TatA